MEVDYTNDVSAEISRINDSFYDPISYENEEDLNSENIGYLIDSYSAFNFDSEDISFEEPIPEKIEYINDNNYNLDLDENIIDELYKEINKNLETFEMKIKQKNKSRHLHHHHHHNKNNKDIEKRKKYFKDTYTIYNNIKKEIVKKKENYLNFKRERGFI